MEAPGPTEPLSLSPKNLSPPGFFQNKPYARETSKKIFVNPTSSLPPPLRELFAFRGGGGVGERISVTKSPPTHGTPFSAHTRAPGPFLFLLDGSHCWTRDFSFWNWNILGFWAREDFAAWGNEMVGTGQIRRRLWYQISDFWGWGVV